jgi:hypothetical protein
MRFVAVDRTIRADDGPFHFYCEGQTCSNHNFFIYEEVEEPRFWMVPWDLDNAFVVEGTVGFTSDNFVRLVHDWDDHDVACEVTPGAASWAPHHLPPSCDPLVRTWGCAFHSLYEESVTQLLEGPLSPETLNPLLLTWTEQVGPVVAEVHENDPDQLSPAEWGAARVDFQGRLDQLIDQASSSAR